MKKVVICISLLLIILAVSGCGIPLVDVDVPLVPGV